MSKSISFADIHAFEECRSQYRHRKQGTQKDVSHKEALGNIVHEVLAVSTDARPALLAGKLANLPASDRAGASSTIVSMVEAADDMEEGNHPDREKHLRFLDLETSWQLVAKPDEIEIVSDERGNPILEIVDVKTSSHLRRKHREQIFFFGLVAFLSKPEFTGSIKLVVRILSSKTDFIFWFSRARADEQLEKVRQVIREIEAARARQDFPTQVGWACPGCNFHKQCQAYLETQGTEQQNNVVQLHASEPASDLVACA